MSFENRKILGNIFHAIRLSKIRRFLDKIDDFLALENNIWASLSDRRILGHFTGSMNNSGYRIFRELPAGKGVADLVFLPRPLHANLPALVVELKWNRDAKAAIQQIKDRCYGKALEDYTGKILVVGISYDKETRKHECIIEEIASHQT